MAQRTILVKVRQAKLVLGVTKYKRGDVFECREQEARMLMQAGVLEQASASQKATRDSPMPGKTGVSNTGQPTAQKPAEQPAQKSVPKKSVSVTAPAPAPAPEPVKPVSGMETDASDMTPEDRVGQGLSRRKKRMSEPSDPSSGSPSAE